MSSKILDVKEKIDDNLVLLSFANKIEDKNWADSIKQNLFELTDLLKSISQYQDKVKRFQKFYE